MIPSWHPQASAIRWGKLSKGNTCLDKEMPEKTISFDHVRSFYIYIYMYYNIQGSKQVYQFIPPEPRSLVWMSDSPCTSVNLFTRPAMAVMRFASAVLSEGSALEMLG